MDSLPVNTSAHERLKYTESYVLHQGSIQPSKMSGFGEEEQHALEHFQKNNQSVKNVESLISPASSKNDISHIKTRQDIDDYIKRRSQIKIGESTNAIQTTLQRNIYNQSSTIETKKPEVFSSKVESIKVIEDSDHIKRKVPQVSETSDKIQLPVIRQSFLEPLSQSDNFDHFKEISESRGQQTVVPLRRNLQQSAVNINLQSKVHQYVDPQQVLSVQPFQDIEQTINRPDSEKHIRNIKKSQINPIIQSQAEAYVEPKSKKMEREPFESIDIQQLSSVYASKKIVKQPHKRNILHQAQNQHQQNNIDFQNVDLKQLQSKLSFEKSIVMEKPFQIQHNPIVLEQIIADNISPNHSLKNVQKRNLEHVPDKPFQTQIESYSENLMNSSLNSQLKRKQQHAVPLKSIEVELGPPHEQSINQSLKSSLRRNMQVSVPKAIEVHLEETDDHLAQKTLKRSLNRNLQILPLEKSFVAEVDPPIMIHLQNEEIQSLPRQNTKGSLKRILEGPHPEPPTVVQIEPIGQQWRQASDAVNMKRSLQHSQQLVQIDHSRRSKIFQDHEQYQEAARNMKQDESIHLSEKFETIEITKNVTLQRRQLKFSNPPTSSAPEPSLNLNEISHQAINDEINSIKEIQPSEALKQSIHINFDPSEEKINCKIPILAKRHLEADKRAFEEPVSSKAQLTCEEGWIPTKNIFKFFKIATKPSEQKSFTKSRINTASLWN